MVLEAYEAKRTFTKTPQPRRRSRAGRGALRFVVQKHAASRLHYDFRLELDGVLKSSAVPKGPSLDPRDKRLAVQVEDHPLDYRTFEGVIPKGNYGAGAATVWDQGTYHAPGTADRRPSERPLRDGLARARLSFVVDGEKLKGEFGLVKLRRGGESAWLLIQKRDSWASDTDITQENLSVASGRILEEVARGRKGRRGRPRAAAPHPNGLRRAAVTAPGAPEAPMQHRVRPMLAEPVAAPFDRAGWLFEVKWDGYRAIAELGPDGVPFYSRNHKSFEQRFAPLLGSLRRLGHEVVLDGEGVVDEQGRSHFQLLQNYQKTGAGRLRYYVFDLLYLDGHDLRLLPLKRRKALLAEVVRGLPDVLLSEHVERRGVAFFRAAVARGLEGIIAKDGKSPYREGVRGPDWHKVKAQRRQEAVIGAFTEPRGSRKDLGALVLGVYEGDALIYIGHTGGGFTAGGLSALRAQREPLVQPDCPFRSKPRTNAPVHWVVPRLVCEVTFQECTHDGRMRQAIFVGLREDKDPRDVRREIPAAPDESPGRPRASRSRRRARAVNRAVRSGQDRWSVPAALGPAEPPLTHLDKLYWPADGYTTGDLIAYYRAMAPVILPCLRDRPQSLHRHPNGIDRPGFFQKDVGRQRPPAWVETATIPSGSGGPDVEYVMCQDAASLLYLANLGCTELNPWHSRVGSLDNPDYLVIDLDPEAVPFGHVVEAAQAVHKMLDRAGTESLCKTSGKHGLHVLVPLGARYCYEQARQFAEIVAKLNGRARTGSPAHHGACPRGGVTDSQKGSPPAGHPGACPRGAVTGR